MNMTRPSKESVQVQEIVELPVDGYIVGILGAEIVNYSWGDILAINFDIAEGEYRGYYTNQYKNSQFENKKFKGVLRLTIPDESNQYFESQQKTFWRNIYAIEDSNTGYTFDIDNLGALKGKKAGIMMFEKEYEYQGKNGFSVQPHSFRTVDEIRNKKFKIPKQKLLKKSTSATSADNDDFMPVAPADLPFGI